MRPLAGERVRKAAEEIFSGLFFMDIGRVKGCDLRAVESLGFLNFLKFGVYEHPDPEGLVIHGDP